MNRLKITNEHEEIENNIYDITIVMFCYFNKYEIVNSINIIVHTTIFI